MSAEGVDKHYLTMPRAEAGMVVGLFGGSFNPPHEGHLLVAEMALKRLGLDQLWWMVTPGNPLKSRSNLLPLQERIALSEALIEDPRIKVTAFEEKLNTSFTAETVAHVVARNRRAHFIWVMGADSLKTFHRWQIWRQIADTVPIAIIDRPGATLSFLSSAAARALHFARVHESEALHLWRKRPPAWTFLHGPRSPLSSTAIRAGYKVETGGDAAHAAKSDLLKD